MAWRNVLREISRQHTSRVLLLLTAVSLRLLLPRKCGSFALLLPSWGRAIPLPPRFSCHPTCVLLNDPTLLQNEPIVPFGDMVIQLSQWLFKTALPFLSL